MITETPTGILLGRFEPGTPEWEQARAGLCITATEIAAVVGLSPWMSRFTLWHKKAGLRVAPFEMTPAIEWGSRLEDAVAQKWADENDISVWPTGTWRHRDREWQRATPDRLGEDLIVEVKTSPMGDDWGPDGAEDGVPIWYRCQAMWQMDTLGLRRTHFGVLISGHDYREYVVDYDESDATALRDAAVQFLNEVRDGVRPPIDGADDTYKTVKVQPDGFEDVDVEIPLDEAARYEIAQQQMAQAKAELNAAKSVVLDRIGTGRRAVANGRRIAYRIAKPDGTTKSLNPYQQKEAA